MFKIAISPCPNDTFIFYALLCNKIDHPYQFQVQFADIAELNQLAIDGLPDIVKISISAYAKIASSYVLGNSGGALGKGCGPLLISKREIDIHNLESKIIGIPGLSTSANLLLDIAFAGKRLTKREMLFSEIEQALLDEDIDIGLIIHESRFTFQDKGLKEVLDLGQYWETKFDLPLPLGGIAFRRSIDQSAIIQLSQYIQKSIEYAWNHLDETLAYCQQYAQEMDHHVMLKHIELYVNDYSYDLGDIGQKAIKTMLSYHNDYGDPLFPFVTI